MAEHDPVYNYQTEMYSSGAVPKKDSPDKQQSPEKKPHISMKRSEEKSGSVTTIIFASALAVVLAGGTIYSLDKRSTMNYKVTALNNELNVAQAENVRLQSELESKMSAKNVEEYAENELGMQKIDSSQIKYIRIQTDDVVSIPKQDEGVLTKIKEFFENCVEYFRG